VTLTGHSSEEALASIGEAIGLEAALALANHFGGVRLYVPKTIGDSHAICVALGRENADRLAAWAGGGSIDVPKQAARRARVRDLHSLGALTISQIALETSFSERHVYRLLRGENDERQLSIFDRL